MDNYLVKITNFLWSQSWQLALLIAVVAIVSWALKNKSAHIRYLLWLIVLAKCLVPPFLTVPLAILPAEQKVKPLAQPILAFEVPNKVDNNSNTIPLISAERDKVQSKTSKFSLPSVHQILGTLWIIGMVVFGCVAITRALRSKLQLRQQRKPLPNSLRSGVEQLLTGFGMKAHPKVWLLNGVGQPFVWGLLRGDIYLPTDYLKIDNVVHRRDILGHEMCHILRFDAAVNSLQIVAQAIFWFHPLVWWANKKTRMEREKCCDEMAVAHLGTRAKEYSAAIVKTLITEHESTRPVPSLAVAGPMKDVEERIRTMLRPGKKFYRRPSLPVVTIIVLTALLAVPNTVVLTARAGASHIFGNPTNLGPTVNSSAAEWDPHISADGLSLYLCSRRPGSIGGVDEEGWGDADIWITTRKTKDDPWGTPVNLGQPVNTSAFEGAPSISHDGLSLYFVSSRPGSNGWLDIWVATRKTKDGPWGTPVNLGPTVNSAAAENGPTISADGLSLYFSSHIGGAYRSGGLGGADIWVTTRKSKDDPWGPPVNLGPTVNTSAGEASPCISTDGLSLYIISDRPGLGNTDIWVTTRKSKDDPWDTPVNLGPEVNGSTYEFNPDISSDGSTLYFISFMRPGSLKADIWQVRVEKGASASSLQSAAFVGDLAKVKNFLYRGVDVNEKNASGVTALHAAATAGHRKVVEFLIAKGAEINKKYATGVTALHAAAIGGHKVVVELLLAKGADIDASTNNGMTPLHWAARGGSREVVELLLSKGANVNTADKDGVAPLHTTAEFGNTDIAALLVDKGANVNTADKDKVAPLHTTAKFGNTDIAALLVDKGADVNAKDKWLWTPIHYACWKNHKDTAELLLARSADVDAREEEGKTPLGVAKEEGYTEIVELLRKHGAKE